MIGWSHGGWAVMAIVDGVYRDEDREPFQAAIALFPPWEFLARLDTPLLVLIGEKDNFSFASRFERSTSSDNMKGLKVEFSPKIFPNAHHAFDFEGVKKDAYGIHSEYNPRASRDAIAQTKDFLAKYLKLKK